MNGDPAQPKSETPTWVKVCAGLAIVAGLYWMFSGEYWSPWEESQFKKTCEESAGGIDCDCAVDYMKTRGLAPNDLDGEGYNPLALGAAFVC